MRETPAPTWRTFQVPSTGSGVLVGLERVSERVRLPFRKTRVEESVLTREFRLHDIVAITTYRGLLDEVVGYLAEGTFGSFVEVDSLSGGVRVCLFRRFLAATTLEVEIEGEREFASEAIADSAAYAEELRARADQENEALWREMRDAETRAVSSRVSAREQAREAAELAAILRDEGRDGPR